MFSIKEIPGDVEIFTGDLFSAWITGGNALTIGLTFIDLCRFEHRGQDYLVGVVAALNHCALTGKPEVAP